MMIRLGEVLYRRVALAADVAEVRVRKEVHITPQDLTGFIVSLGA